MPKIALSEKEELIQKIQDCHNPYILYRLEQLLKREETLAPLEKMIQDYPWLVQESVPRDMRVMTRLTPPKYSLLAKYENRISPFMYFLGLLMLGLAAALINLMSHEAENISVALFQSKVALAYGLLWILFLAEFLLLCWEYRHSEIKPEKFELFRRAWVLLFPPLRMGSRHILDPSLQWLPFKGWSYRNEGMLKYLKEKFSIPMIVIALLIVPVLIIDWKFNDPVAEYLQTDLSFWLDMVQAFIWLAFAYEFILMISISREKFEYAQKNWIDLLIILLPFIAFVRTIRIIKIARLSQLARGYKLRGLLMKARQGLFFAGFLYRIMTLREFQIKSLKKKLDQNQKEREILEEELIELYRLHISNTD